MSRNSPMCQYASCTDYVQAAGVTVSLKYPTSFDEVRAVFCCAAHAAAALTCLATQRGETVPETPRSWKSA